MVRYQTITAGVLASALSASAYTYTASDPRAHRVEKQFSQEFNDGYNVLKHYGGNGPYSTRPTYGIERDTPSGCEVDQVSAGKTRLVKNTIFQNGHFHTPMLTPIQGYHDPPTRRTLS